MENLNDYQKLDWISFAIQEALNGNLGELEQALELVEDLRDNSFQEPINDPNGIFLIFNEETKLYWSNTDGWCDNTRSIFSFEEKQALNLPIGGRWVSLAHDPEYYPEPDDREQAFIDAQQD